MARTSYISCAIVLLYNGKNKLYFVSNCSAISWQEQVIFREQLFCYIKARTSYISCGVVLLYHGKNKLYFVSNCSAISLAEQVIFREQLFCYIMARTSYISCGIVLLYHGKNKITCSCHDIAEQLLTKYNLFLQ
jgi:hypothetical protein